MRTTVVIQGKDEFDQWCNLVKVLMDRVCVDQISLTAEIYEKVE